MFNSASSQMLAHTDLSSACFLQLLTPIDFELFSVQSNPLNFGLPAFLLPSGLGRNAFLTILSSHHSYYETSPLQSSYFYCCYRIWLSIRDFQRFLPALSQLHEAHLENLILPLLLNKFVVIMNREYSTPCSKQTILSSCSEPENSRPTPFVLCLENVF